MTVIRPNSVSGINSITAQANEIKIFKSDGTQGGLMIDGANLNATSGISTVAALTVTGNVSVGGTLTYQDVTNIDSVGVVTARAGVNVTGGNVKIGTTTEGEVTADNLTIADAGHCGVTIRSGTSSEGNIFFSDGTSGDSEYRGMVRYDHSNDAMVFKTAASERVRIDSSGNMQVSTGQFTVGITASTGLQLINDGTFGTIQSADLKIRTAATERLRVTSTGQLLLGINNAVASDVSFQIHGASSGVGPILNLTNDTGDCRIFFGQDNSSGGANAQGQIRYNVANNYLAAYAGGAERLRITSAGNVGIGTNDPANILHLRNDAPIITSEATNNSSGLRVNVIGQTTDTTQLFRVQDSNTTKFTILRSGNVGVMDSAPSSLLSISQTNGNAKLQIKRSNTANNTDDYGSILWRSSGGTVVGGINVARETAENNGYMFFQTANGGSLTERLRISADGGIIKGSANSATSSQIIQTFFNKRGSVIGKRVHQGSSSGSTTHNLLTINSFQSNNTRFFAYVTVHYVNPISNLGGRMETYAGATTAGARVTGTFTVADGGRWGNPGGTLSLSWSGNTLQLNTYNNAYMEYSVDITYVAYDGASVTFIKN